MKVAIVGSRTLYGARAALEIEKFLSGRDPSTTEIVSGGAKGVDALARLFAVRGMYKLTEFLPDWSTGIGAGFARNSKIVDYSDEVLCIWDGKSRGCIDTVRKARAAGKPVHLVKL